MLADRNRFRHEFKVLYPGVQKHTSVVISDGKRVGGPGLGEELILFPKATLPDFHEEMGLEHQRRAFALVTAKASRALQAS